MSFDRGLTLQFLIYERRAMDLSSSIYTSESGMKAQAMRMKIVAQNIANQNSTATKFGEQPYRRKTIFFESIKNNDLNIEMVRVSKIGRDRSGFNMKFEPSHPSADANGYVLYPNVNNVIEIADGREAGLFYEANLAALTNARNMINQTLEILNRK